MIPPFTAAVLRQLCSLEADRAATRRGDTSIVSSHGYGVARRSDAEPPDGMVRYVIYDPDRKAVGLADIHEADCKFFYVSAFT